MHPNNNFTRKSEGKPARKAPQGLTSKGPHNLSTYYDPVSKKNGSRWVREQEYKRAGQGESESEPIIEQQYKSQPGRECMCEKEKTEWEI